MTRLEPEERPPTAFERAVRQERDAIRRHDSAAAKQEAIAAALERRALAQGDDLLRDQALAHAANARERAESARTRAARARERLRSEGVDPDAD